MTKVFKAGALWLAIAVVVWLITIWRWQSTAYDASTADIVGQLFVLPLLLAGAFLLALWGVGHLREQAGRPASGAEVKLPVVPAGQLGHVGYQDEAARQACAWVLAEAVTLATGAVAEAAWSGIQSQTVRPGLDVHLQDVDGMPVFTSRVPELDLDDWLDAHAELRTAQGARLSEPVLRGLALLEGPLSEMLAVITELALADEAADAGSLRVLDGTEMGAGHTMKAHLSGVGGQVSKATVQAREAHAPQLTIRLVLPSHWPEAERAAAIDWLRSQCGALLDWAEGARAKGLRWVTDVVEQPEALWAEVDQQMVQWTRQARPELLLMLAVDSAVSVSHIDRMQAVGELFTSAHQTGKVPGEGAVGLLLANAHWPGLAQRESLPVRMWRPVLARRDKSADAAGRVGTTALSAALTHAVNLAQGDKDGLLVVSDADHRASRTGELFEALLAVVPGLDPMLAVARVGESCGELGLARALVPCALACTSLRASGSAGQVALATNVQSSHERVVVALAPWVQPAVTA